MTDNFRNRRRMAWLSFLVLVAVCAVMLFRLALGDDPNAWTGIATMVLGCLTGIVGTYSVAASYEKVKLAQHPEPAER